MLMKFAVSDSNVGSFGADVILSLCQDVCRDIYDLYAEYEEEEVQDRFPVAPHLLLSPARHLNLNINVGGTVSSGEELISVG